MVFVWSRLSDGDPNYTLAQVAINDLILGFAFAPIAALLLFMRRVSGGLPLLISSCRLPMRLMARCAALPQHHGSYTHR
jgi:ACR3 family arsenite efflux pump ArsB